MTKADFTDIIKSCEIFASLGDADISHLTKKLIPQTLHKNAFLFKQGEISNSLYVLATGKLVILLKAKNRPERMISDVHVGESIGEASAVSHEPRAATVKAIETSTVLKISADVFAEICRQFPAVLLASMNLLFKRSRMLTELFTTHAPAKKHIVFAPANKDAILNTFVSELKKRIGKRSRMIVVNDADPEFQQQYKTASQVKKYIEDLTKTYNKILYILTLHDSALAKICLDKVDMLYVVACSDSKAYINPHTLKLIDSKELLYKCAPELIMLHTKEKGLPSNTRKWLQLAKLGIPHQIRLHKESDWQRIMRFIRSEAIGLVLGGGGVRGWAHVGALKALHEAGIPIDALGGSSGGAIVAAYYALHENLDKAGEELHDLSLITRQTMYLRGLTWPLVSLFSSAAYTKQLEKIFGKARMENLWLPLFCITCNLSKSTAVTHRRGMLWKKIRGSTAVPGVYPPLVINGELHQDGGIVDNLPVGAMHKFSSNIGTVIAVELIHNTMDAKDYKFPPILPFWQTLFTKLGLIHKDYHFPPLVDTFLRSLLVGSAVKQNESAKAADVLISPDLSKYNLLSVTKAQEQELIDLGYKATVKALKNWNWGGNTRPKDKNVKVKTKSIDETSQEQ
jgi:predicted acylesterase/phospholipase RssA/CRP-like cAMP-binding protein